MIGNLICRIVRLFGGAHRMKRVTVKGVRQRECRLCKHVIPVRHRAPKNQGALPL